MDEPRRASTSSRSYSYHCGGWEIAITAQRVPDGNGVRVAMGCPDQGDSTGVRELTLLARYEAAPYRLVTLWVGLGDEDFDWYVGGKGSCSGSRKATFTFVNETTLMIRRQADEMKWFPEEYFRGASPCRPLRSLTERITIKPPHPAW